MGTSSSPVKGIKLESKIELTDEPPSGGPIVATYTAEVRSHRLLADDPEPSSDQQYDCDCCHDTSDGGTEGDTSNELEQFTEILEAVALDKVPDLAVRIRRRLLSSQTTTSTPTIEPAVVVTPPLCGSYHVLFPIDFADGVRWLLKVAGTGTRARWDDASARSLACEALTMQLLLHETTVPLPRVYDFSSSIREELGVPYILIEWIDGRSLQDVWFDFYASEGDLRARRTRTLCDIATAMVQLQRFSSDRGGALEFGPDGAPSGIGPFRIPDSHAMLQRLEAEDDPDESPLFAYVGPFDDAESYYLRSLSAWESRNDTHWVNCDFALLKLFLSWILEYERTSDPSGLPAFVLTHPDLDIQNVLVDPDSGAVKAIIDWDGVHLKPRSIGNEAYPSWLTRDWDPAMYAYKPGMEFDPNPETMREDSPATLKLYRDLYASSVQAQLPPRDASVGNGGGGDIRASQVSVTRQSVAFENLAIATEDRICSHEILIALFDKIKVVIAEELIDTKYEHGTQARCTERTSVVDEQSRRQPDGGDSSATVCKDQGVSPSAKISGDSNGSETSGEHKDQGSGDPTEYVPFVDALLRGDADPAFIKKLQDGFRRLMAGEKGLI